jgi:hypothetical protein
MSDFETRVLKRAEGVTRKVQKRVFSLWTAWCLAVLRIVFNETIAAVWLALVILVGMWKVAAWIIRNDRKDQNQFDGPEAIAIIQHLRNHRRLMTRVAGLTMRETMRYNVVNCVRQHVWWAHGFLHKNNNAQQLERLKENDQSQLYKKVWIEHGVRTERWRHQEQLSVSQRLVRKLAFRQTQVLVALRRTYYSRSMLCPDWNDSVMVEVVSLKRKFLRELLINGGTFEIARHQNAVHHKRKLLEEIRWVGGDVSRLDGIPFKAWRPRKREWSVQYVETVSEYRWVSVFYRPLPGLTDWSQYC